MAIAIKVNDVHKKFRLYSDKGASLKERLLFRKRYEYQERWALRGITFEVGSGEAVGIVGENGCGKSTLLKMMTKIMYPNQGNIEITGRVSSLIELGAGFHPDMSGRENIYINASIFGLSHAEIERRIKDIIDFSEIEEFIDNPVRTYSSGMYMRLAFSVAINVDADVLLIDEILGVGDASFQAKCFGKLREIKANGTTIVIVSHSLSQIEQICDRSIWISNGVIQAIGTPREVHPQYLDFMGKKEAPAILQTEMVTKDESENAIDTDEATTGSNTKNRWGSGDAKILSVHLLDEWEKPVTKLKAGNKCIIKMEYEVKRPLESEIVGFAFYRNDGTYCYGTNTLIDQLEPITLNPKGSIEICISELTLLPADYTIDVAICSQTGFDYDYWRYSLSFSVYSDIQDVGISRIQHKWLVQ